MLGTRKDKGGGDSVVFEDMQQEAAFIFLIDEIHRLLDGIRGRGDRGHLYLGRIYEYRTGQLLDLGWHSSREEKRMFLCRKLREDLADIVDKTHVQHAVRFIEDKILDVPEIEQLLITKVEETAGSGYQDIRSALDPVYLRLLRYAAKDHEVFRTGVAAISGETFIDLDGQFPGRGEDQGANGARAPTMAVGELGCIFSQQL